MGCADVCIDMERDSGNDFYVESIRVARKPHRCCECRETIRSGDRYEYASGKSDGDVWSVKSCLHCREIRKVFVCGSWVFGDLWEHIEEGMFPHWLISSPIDCLAKIESVDTRNFLRSRFDQWREDQVA